MTLFNLTFLLVKKQVPLRSWNYINNANNTLEITKDYRNDNYAKGINITRDNLIINGNNHTLDGNHKRIFNITASNVTINNLIFTNAFSSTGVGAIINEGVIFLNNVTFINNTAFNGAAIASFGGSVSLNNAVFIDNSANEFGGTIVIYYGELSVSMHHSHQRYQMTVAKSSPWALP